MARVYEGIDEHWREWIGRQPLYFVGTAPLADDGHVNVSPKGPIESFRIVDEHTVEYEDHVGSGAETVAHIRDNGRVCIMFCAFAGPPRIVRLHGRGEAIRRDDSRFDELMRRAAFADLSIPEARRSVIRVEVARVSDSCGYGVPLMSLDEQRPHSRLWAQKKLRTGGARAIEDYVADRNARSIDGLPGVPTAPR